MNTPESFISLENIKHYWPKSTDSLAVNKLSFDKNKSYFIQGSSGCGKSTLLNLISGILRPQEGSIYVEDTVINKLSESARDKFRAKNYGIIFQQFNLVPFLSVKENIELVYRNDDPKTNSKIEKLISQLNLPNNILNKKTKNLSIGQQQRVACIRAIINQPKIILADEPTSALDEQNQNIFVENLLQIKGSNDCTLIFVSHNKNLSKHFDITLEWEEIIKQ